MVLSVELLKIFGINTCSPKLNDLLYDADADGKFFNTLIKRRMSLFCQRGNEPVAIHLATDQIDWEGLETIVKELSQKDNLSVGADQVSITYNNTSLSLSELIIFNTQCNFSSQKLLHPQGHLSAHSRRSLRGS